ncbi:hypothetical protein N7478_009570 [Penicillium angulare]|uniref:uncharacterized protein n=1 Tax=Penicillium angulare TaxID=116970 RepID=UPI00254237C2|nr:uncharacterized protein N7478_009570 [Penicillium angulare]KAJ5266762.1 hypothetical protein N7478_009570 [Penicillium angulare]
MTPGKETRSEHVSGAGDLGQRSPSTSEFDSEFGSRSEEKTGEFIWSVPAAKKGVMGLPVKQCVSGQF